MQFEQKSVGLLLTSGAQENKGVYEPNPEGQVRSLGALADLNAGNISRLYVVGGQLVFGIPTSAIYAAFLHQQSRDYSLKPGSIQRLDGRVDTGSDLERVVRHLPKEELSHLVIFSSGFHLQRAELVLKILGINATGRACEEIIRGRSQIDDDLINLAYTPEFLALMKEREAKQIAILNIDLIPIIGQVHPGLKLLEFLASRGREGESFAPH